LAKDYSDYLANHLPISKNLAEKGLEFFGNLDMVLGS